MKVYIVWRPEANTYSYAGFTYELDSVFTDEAKAKAYCEKLNKGITRRDEKATLETIQVTE